jgi:hypothetical protein
MDLRIPSGWFFLLLGAILIVVSFAGTPKAPLTEANVDLYAGGAMALFGGLMLWWSRIQTL